MRKLANNFMTSRAASRDASATSAGERVGSSRKSRLRHATARLSTVPLRRKLRAALPSSLVGLVAFSFVVLAFGTVVYTAALPSLVAASPVVANVADAVDAAAAQASEGDARAVDAADSDAASGEDAESAGSVTDAASADAASPALSTANGAGASSDAGVGDNASQDAGAPADAGQTSDTPSTTTTDSGNGSSTTDDPNKQSATTGEQSQNDAWLAEDLPQEAQRLDTLHAQVVALNSTMGSDYLGADASTRNSRERDASSLFSTMQSAYTEAVNRIAPRVDRGSSYEKTANSTIGAYRCLMNAAGIISTAWSDSQSSQNIGDSARLSVLLAEARTDEASALEQYDSYRSALG